MATMDYWVEAPMSRTQITLFAPTLDAMISEDDPVRVFGEVLSGVDWSAWECKYDGKHGRPPIHPQYVATAILYGLCRGIRSSRKLAEACCYRLDFMWPVEGRTIDLTTFAKCRTEFSDPLKDLFKQVCRIAMNLGPDPLGGGGVRRYTGKSKQQPLCNPYREDSGREAGRTVRGDDVGRGRHGRRRNRANSGRGGGLPYAFARALGIHGAASPASPRCVGGKRKRRTKPAARTGSIRKRIQPRFPRQIRTRG